MKRHPAKPRARKPARRPVKITPESPLTPYDANAAAIDIGATSHWVAVSPEGRAESVREFGVFTADLYRIADWLKQCGVKRVAMESTGVYWIPLFEVLEERGFEVRLVDARKVKNVSGRKSDLLDCQWLRQLHSYGLLAGAFRPAEEVLSSRTQPNRNRAAEALRRAAVSAGQGETEIGAYYRRKRALNEARQER